MRTFIKEVFIIIIIINDLYYFRNSGENSFYTWEQAGQETRYIGHVIKRNIVRQSKKVSRGKRSASHYSINTSDTRLWLRKKLQLSDVSNILAVKLIRFLLLFFSTTGNRKPINQRRCRGN